MCVCVCVCMVARARSLGDKSRANGGCEDVHFRVGEGEKVDGICVMKIHELPVVFPPGLHSFRRDGGSSRMAFCAARSGAAEADT